MVTYVTNISTICKYISERSTS